VDSQGKRILNWANGSREAGKQGGREEGRKGGKRVKGREVFEI
jgi:hypothetical protein